MFLVCPPPTLLLPYRLTCLGVPWAGGKLQPDSMEFPESRFPNPELVLRRRDDVECLIRPVEDIDDGQPTVFILLCELELFAVISRIRTAAQLLDVLDGN